MSIGNMLWAVPGGCIPLESTGPEPAFVSQDRLCLLNAGGEETGISLTVFYADREPVGPYRLALKARQVRHIRVNDLIEPEALPLATEYALLIESDHPVVVQFTRMDTGSEHAALLGSMAYGE